MPWTFPTRADAPDTPPTATCGCGRVTASDMLYRVDVYTGAERAAIGWAADTPYVCDSCLSMGVRTHALTLSDLASRHGAPADVVAAIAAHESY